MPQKIKTIIENNLLPTLGRYGFLSTEIDRVFPANLISPIVGMYLHGFISSIEFRQKINDMALSYKESVV